MCRRNRVIRPGVVSSRGVKSRTQTDARVKRITGLNITFRKLVSQIQHERALQYEQARRTAHLLLCEMEALDHEEKRGTWRFCSSWHES